MTNERAVEILNPEHREHYESIEPVKEACRMGMEALKKQIPKKPLYENKYDDCVVYSCPACKDEKLILDGDNYCTTCGQALDWSDKS